MFANNVTLRWKENSSNRMPGGRVKMKERISLGLSKNRRRWSDKEYRNSSTWLLIRWAFVSWRERQLDLVCRLNHAVRKKRILIFFPREGDALFVANHLRLWNDFPYFSTLRVPLWAISALRDPTEVPIRQFLSRFACFRHPILPARRSKLFLLLYNYEGRHLTSFSTVIKPTTKTVWKQFIRHR